MTLQQKFIGVSGYAPPTQPANPYPMDELARIPGDSRWAVADDGLLEALALGQQVRRGPMGRHLRRWLGWADRIKLAGWLVLMVGLMDLARHLWRQSGSQQRGAVPDRVFVGFGAGSEAVLFDRYVAEEGKAVMRLNETDIASFSTWHRVGVRSGMRALWSAYGAASRAIAQLPPAFAPARLDFLTFVGLRLGRYGYMLAWFRLLRARHPHIREVCFLSPDSVAYAAVAAGVPTRFMQHGLVRGSLLLPDFGRIDALTPEEKQFFQRRVPTARMIMQRFPRLDVSSLNRGILIASVYETHDVMSQILPVLEWARRNGQPLWVRPHPNEDRRFWTNTVLGSDVRIEDSDASFLSALQRLRPRLVFSWYSTALADALLCGIIPVTVSRIGSAALHDLVFPLSERALVWERHGDEIARVLEDDGFYRETLQALQHTEASD